MGKCGYIVAGEKYHWPLHAKRFVDQLEAWTTRTERPAQPAGDEPPAITVPAGEPRPSGPAE